MLLPLVLSYDEPRFVDDEFPMLEPLLPEFQELFEEFEPLALLPLAELLS
jgi:hypothetical protein